MLAVSRPAGPKAFFSAALLAGEDAKLRWTVTLAGRHASQLHLMSFGWSQATKRPRSWRGGAWRWGVWPSESDAEALRHTPAKGAASHRRRDTPQPAKAPQPPQPLAPVRPRGPSAHFLSTSHSHPPAEGRALAPSLGPPAAGFLQLPLPLCKQPILPAGVPGFCLQASFGERWARSGWGLKRLSSSPAA